MGGGRQQGVRESLRGGDGAFVGPLRGIEEWIRGEEKVTVSRGGGAIVTHCNRGRGWGNVVVRVR